MRKAETANLQISCRKCGVAFAAKRKTRKYCSDECRHAFLYPAHPRTETSKCEGCGASIVKKRPNHRFCSSLCSFRAYTDQNRDWYNAKMRALNNKTRQIAPWKLLIASAKDRARKAQVLFDLDEAWGRERWTGRCEISGLPFVAAEGKRSIFSATIDRKKAGDGYVKNNCRIILWAVNAFKHDGSEEDMYRIAEAITLQRSQQNEIVAQLSLPT